MVRHAVWVHFRFTLSFRDVEELLAQRGIEVSYETVRCWTLKFGRLFAKLASYRAGVRDLGLVDRHRPGRMRENNWAENSHLPIRRRERKQQNFKSRATVQRFLATHAAVYNVFNLQPHLIRRPTLRQFRAEAHKTWAAATATA